MINEIPIPHELGDPAWVVGAVLNEEALVTPIDHEDYQGCQISYR